MTQLMIDLNLLRACIHAAGRFLVAYKYRPARAVSIRVGEYPSGDAAVPGDYAAFARARTIDFEEAEPRLSVTFRAAGLAAEGLVLLGQFETLMNDPGVRESIKPELNEAWSILMRAGLLLSPGNPIFGMHWQLGFDEAWNIMENSVDDLQAIADYILSNPGREIPREELVQRLDLQR